MRLSAAAWCVTLRAGCTSGIGGRHAASTLVRTGWRWLTFDTVFLGDAASAAATGPRHRQLHSMQAACASRVSSLAEPKRCCAVSAIEQFDAQVPVLLRRNRPRFQAPKLDQRPPSTAPALWQEKVS